MKILAISTTRADFGILENLLKKLKKDKFFKLNFLVTGSHFNRDQGHSLKEILKRKISIDKKLNIKFNSNNLESIFSFNSKLILKFFKYLKNTKPDIVLVFGDRFEMLLLTFCSYLMRIPIAHLHGGEISEGSMDDSMRHAMTKLSNIHFVSNRTHRERVIQLGEQPKYVKNVGSLIEEKIQNLKIENKDKLEKLHDLTFANKNFIVTYHPDTIKSGNTKKNFEEILKSIKKFDYINFFFTAPGSDFESDIIKKKIIEFKKNKKNIFYIKNFGSQSYLSMLHHVNGLIGNSSSGILEMPIVKNYTINIGNRQKGRGDSNFIYNVQPKEEEISKLILKISRAKIRKKNFSKIKNATIKKIISNLKKIRLDNIVYKKFFDL